MWLCLGIGWAGAYGLLWLGGSSHLVELVNVG